jgi:hypothetical protein
MGEVKRSNEHECSHWVSGHCVECGEAIPGWEPRCIARGCHQYGIHTNPACPLYEDFDTDLEAVGDQVADVNRGPVRARNPQAHADIERRLREQLDRVREHDFAWARDSKPEGLSSSFSMKML